MAGLGGVHREAACLFHLQYTCTFSFIFFI